MFGKLTVLICFINIAIAGNTHVVQTTPSSVPISTPAPQLAVSIAPNDFPLEAKVLQSQPEAVNPTVFYTNQAPYAAYPSTYGYVLSPDPRIINPAAVKVTSGSIAVPVPEKQVAIQGHEQITAHEPVETTVVNNPVRYVTAPIGYAPAHSGVQVIQKVPETAIRGDFSNVYVPSKLVQYPIRNYVPVAPHPAVQYVTRPVAEVTNTKLIPVAAKKVTIEAYKSVTAHPPPSQYLQPNVNRPIIQYVPVPASYPATSSITSISPVHNPEVTPAVIKPVAVPVIYNTEVPAKPQYIAVTNNGLPVPGIIKYKAPVPISQSIPVPVIYPQKPVAVGYKVPVGYTKSIGNSFAGPLSYPIPRYTGYSKAVAYSPAPAVSSVRFSGLGVNYGW